MMVGRDRPRSAEDSPAVVSRRRRAASPYRDLTLAGRMGHPFEEVAFQSVRIG
jgi:hypothetical protein